MFIFKEYLCCYRSTTSDSNEKEGVKTLTKTLANLSGTYRWIKVKGSGKARDYESSLSNYKVELDTDIEDSWLSSPEPEQGDLVGYWPTSTEFPTASANIVPGVKKDSLSTPIPHAYEKDSLENFFSAKSLISNSKIKLNDKAFEPPTMAAPAKENAHVVDSLLRSALSENAICDKFIMSLMEKVKEWEQPGEDDNLSVDEKFKVMIDSLKLASISSLRSKQYTVAAFVNNKMSFRQRVLDKCTGPKYSKDILKNSNLATPFLFGDVPDSLIKKFDHSPANRESYMIRPMASSTSKRALSPSAAPNAKRSTSFNSDRVAHSSNTQNSYERSLGRDNFHRTPRARAQTKSQRARPRGGKGGKK